MSNSRARHGVFKSSKQSKSPRTETGREPKVLTSDAERLDLERRSVRLSAISAFAAALAAVVSCVQTMVVSSDRKTPYQIALFQRRSAEYQNFVSAAQKLDSAFRKALFVVPVFLETADDARAMTDDQLRQANSKVAFMIGEYTDFMNVGISNKIGWQKDTTAALEQAMIASEEAMGCYFAFGPEARNNMPPVCWAKIRALTAERCPNTRQGVVKFNENLMSAYRLMERDIEAVQLQE